MNGNNSWGMSPFVKFPKHDLGPIAQRQPLPSRELVSMGQLMEDGGDPFREDMPMSAMMPQEQMPRQQDYDEGQPPVGKKILGMPKDRFIALMGSIAQAFGGDSPSGRMGAGLINMADMMRTERIEGGKARAAEAKERREARKPKEKKYAGDIKAFSDIYGRPPSSAKELREFKKTVSVEKEKVPSAWEATYKEMEGKVNPKTGRPYTETEKVAAYKAIGAKKPGEAPKIERFTIGDRLVPHTYNIETGKYEPVPGMEGKKVKVGAEEKPITPDKAREKLFAIAKFKSSLSKTGGWNETVFELMAQKDPEFAKRALSINSSKAEVNTTIKELENYYKGIVSGKPTAKEEEPFDIEEQDARDAINQGIPADRVREMYKRRTGKELGF